MWVFGEPGQEMAKTVIVKVDGKMAMAVLPAPHKVNFDKAHRLFDDEPTLATEDEIADLFPDCEIGAEPPFGNLYNLPVYVSPELAEDEIITFNAGTHREAVRMTWADYRRLAQPRLELLSDHEEERL